MSHPTFPISHILILFFGSSDESSGEKSGSSEDGSERGEGGEADGRDGRGGDGRGGSRASEARADASVTETESAHRSRSQMKSPIRSEPFDEYFDSHCADLFM